MLRRIVSSILIISFVSLLYTSCVEHSPTRPRGDGKTIFDDLDVAAFTVQNPGKLHNDVLFEFHERHSLLSGEKIPLHSYARYLSESINTVFRENDIPFQVTDRDIVAAVGELARHGERGGYDFFSTEHDLPVEMFEYLETECGAHPDVLDQCMKMMTALRDNVRSSVDHDPRLGSFCTLDTSDPGTGGFIADISRSSYAFWTSITVCEAAGTPNLDWEEIKKKYFSFEPDITAAVLCAVIPSIPGLIGVLLSLAASTAFSLGDFDWNEFGHYHSR